MKIEDKQIQEACKKAHTKKDPRWLAQGKNHRPRTHPKTQHSGSEGRGRTVATTGRGSPKVPRILRFLCDFLFFHMIIVRL